VKIENVSQGVRLAACSPSVPTLHFLSVITDNQQSSQGEREYYCESSVSDEYVAPSSGLNSESNNQLAMWLFLLIPCLA
jgi:hypothetical protein